MIVKMIMVVVVTWFPTCDIPSARKWLFKVVMADALEVQSFLIQRLVGLLLAESTVITGSHPRGEGGGVDHCPCSWSTVHLWLEIRSDSQKIRGWGDGGVKRRTEPKGEKEKWLRVKWPFSCHYKQQGSRSTSWVSISTHSTPAL